MSSDDLPTTDRQSGAPRGLLAAVGAAEELEDLDDMIDQIYRRRESSEDRRVDLDADDLS
jgi:hypothetical protein